MTAQTRTGTARVLVACVLVTVAARAQTERFLKVSR